MDSYRNDIHRRIYEPAGAPAMHEGEIKIVGDAILFEIGEGISFGFTVRSSDPNEPQREEIDAAIRRAHEIIPHVRAGCQYAADQIERIPGLGVVRQASPRTFRAEIMQLLAECHLDTKLATTAAILYAGAPDTFGYGLGVCLCKWGRSLYKAYLAADRMMPDTALSDAAMDALGGETPDVREGASRYLEACTELLARSRERDAESATSASGPSDATGAPPHNREAHDRIIADAIRQAESPAPTIVLEGRRGPVS